MALKAILDTVDDLPDDVKEHYKKDDKTGQFVLDITDVDSVPRVRALKDEAAQHRIKAREAEKALAPFKALGEPAKVQEQLDRIPELEAAAEGKGTDESKVAALVEAKVKTKLAPVERERDQLKTQLVEKDTVIASLKTADSRRKLADALTTAAKDSKVRDTALEDVVLAGERVFTVDEDGRVVTRADVSGLTPGLTPKDWLSDIQTKRPHWWGETVGGGAGGSRNAGSGGSNPFTNEGWNLTEQGRVIKEHGMARAEQLAKAAGTTVGGPQPAPKK